MAYKDVCQEISKGNLNRTFDKETLTHYAHTTRPSEFNNFLDETYWYTFEDTEFIQQKMNLIKSERLGGAFIWNLAFDDFEGKCDPSTNFPLTSFIYEKLEGKNASEPIIDESLLCTGQGKFTHNEYCSKGWHYFNLTNNCYYSTPPPAYSEISRPFENREQIQICVVNLYEMAPPYDEGAPPEYSVL
uniref:GH18 domain-containing protein n=1 Tax=Acrobeloides nanus TaxID=290746 RepID=A0A914BV06_9BILA